MRILTRYLIRSHIGPFFFSLSALTGLLIVNTVARRFQDLAGKGLSFRVFAEFFVFSIPATVALTVPMAVLVAVLYAFGQLSAENEITALKASGVNVLRLLVPVLMVAALLTGFMVWFMNDVLPDANHRLANLLVDIARKTPTLQLKEQVVNEIQTGDLRTRYYLQAARIDPQTNGLQDVAIYDLSNPSRYRTIYADSGRMAFNRTRTDLYLTLFDGWVDEASSRDPNSFQRVFYTTQRIRMAGVGNELSRRQDTYRSDREMSMGMLQAQADSARRELTKVRATVLSRSLEAVHGALAGTGNVVKPVTQAPARGAAAPTGPPRARAPTAKGGAATPETTLVARVEAAARARAREDSAETAEARFQPVVGKLMPPDLLTRGTGAAMDNLRERARILETRIASREVEWQKKLAIPAACLVFVLIGAPIAIRFPRGGAGMVIAVSLTIFGIYYVGLIGGQTLGEERTISPFWAMWAANVVFLGLGLVAVSLLPHASATQRGGGWEDLAYSLRSLAAAPLRLLRRGA